jgi:pimeloyl-ACP methyl ester carboxylesterase
MYCREWGPGSPSGIPVVALHGLASSSRWYDLVAPLLADTHRIVAPDQRGHGRSEHPSTGYDWQSLAADVVGLMEAVGLDRPAVLGHSWGGYVALALAAKFPRSVSRVVLVDGGFMDWTRWPGAHREWFDNLLQPRRVTGDREEYLASQRAHLADSWSQELEPIVMSMVHTGEDGQVRDILDPANHAQVLDALWTEPPSTMFRRVECPVLVVPAGPGGRSAGSQFARMREEMAEAAQAAIADCRVQWVPDTIHDIGYDKPAELSEILRLFLAEGANRSK